ncbi:Leucine aminopeptidase 1 [Monascus purpureus]|uniref:Peptide hydrolase n=1 Tax=Monascus purpureus TaxID=5098 RepID=A0A507QPM4_MONPU|nr:Leucine aminopeptidase 1 [Monascus purpureus]BDD54927.1 Leucine aminopeptidase 1 [Monascus purpureus]
MKFLAALALGATATSVLAAVIPQQDPLTGPQVYREAEQYLIELEPGNTIWVTEDEKWSLRLDGVKFMDVTEEHHNSLYPTSRILKTVEYPVQMEHVDSVVPLTQSLSKDNMKADLEHFTSFYTRYYQSSTGVESATWLYSRVLETLEQSGATAYGASVEKFQHSFQQFSIIARIPGQSNKTVVVGAHQDSINLLAPSFLPAPGADDDGSGTVTILEALRVLLQSEEVVNGSIRNTLEFHWYAAEEGGLLGSQSIFSQYSSDGRDIKAMLQQDMTGYSQGTLDAGLPESVAVITDYVDPGLTAFIKEVITTYCDVPYVESQCGYACSDNASARKYGYPSAFVMESEFEHSSDRIHTTGDKIDYLSFDHMVQHAKLTLAFAYELAFASL